MIVTFVVTSIVKALEGALRGIGKQSYGAALVILCYYFLGLPLIPIFVFKLNLGMEGMWMGPAVATLI